MRQRGGRWQTKQWKVQQIRQKPAGQLAVCILVPNSLQLGHPPVKLLQCAIRMHPCLEGLDSPQCRRPSVTFRSSLMSSARRSAELDRRLAAICTNTEGGGKLPVRRRTCSSAALHRPTATSSRFTARNRSVKKCAGAPAAVAASAAAVSRGAAAWRQ